MRVLIISALIVLADQISKLAVKGASIPWPFRDGFLEFGID